MVTTSSTTCARAHTHTHTHTHTHAHTHTHTHTHTQSFPLLSHYAELFIYILKTEHNDWVIENCHTYAFNNSILGNGCLMYIHIIHTVRLEPTTFCHAQQGSDVVCNSLQTSLQVDLSIPQFPHAKNVSRCISEQPYRCNILPVTSCLVEHLLKKHLSSEHLFPRRRNAHPKAKQMCRSMLWWHKRAHIFVFHPNLTHIFVKYPFQTEQYAIKSTEEFLPWSKKIESLVYISVFTMCSFPHSQILFIFFALVNQGRLQNNYTHAPSIGEWQTYLQALTKLTALLSLCNEIWNTIRWTSAGTTQTQLPQ